MQLLAVVLALVEAALIGVLLGSKRAMVAALMHGIAKLKLGSSVVGVCFRRLLKVSARERHGERGTPVAQTVERLPLAQAEQRLIEAIDVLMRAAPEGGGMTVWFRRWLHRRLLGLVRDCTLAQFREEGAQEGGLDLIQVQAEVEAHIDELLIARAEKGPELLDDLGDRGPDGIRSCTDLCGLGDALNGERTEDALTPCPSPACGLSI